MEVVDRPLWAWRAHHIQRDPDDHFFADGDVICCPKTRTIVQSVDESFDDREKLTFKCQSADCKQTFSTVGQYEQHYNSAHRHPCIECHRGFPTNFLLEIHLTEWHDPLFDLQCHQFHMYRCLLESCPRKFPTHQARRDHVIRIHKYPANFRFEKPPSGKSSAQQTKNPEAKKSQAPMVTIATDAMDTVPADSSQPSSGSISARFPLSLASLAQGSLKKSSDSTLTSSRRHEEGMEEDRPPTAAPSGAARLSVERPPKSEGHLHEMEVDGSTSHSQGTSRRFNYKATVPKTICFGAGSQKGFHGSRRRGGKRGGRHWHQTQVPDTDTTLDLETMDMDDLSQALDTS